MIKYIIILFATIIANITLAQTADFSIANTACISQDLEITNLSAGASDYIWDFCGDEFSTSPAEAAIGSLANVTRVRGSTMVYDTLNDNYVLFATDDSKIELNRIVLGNELGTQFTQDQVTFSSGSLKIPQDIVVVKNSDDTWLGFVGSATSGVGVQRIEFGSSLLNNDVSITDLGTFGEGNIQMRGVRVWEESGNYYLVALNLNNNRFVIVNYGNSLLNSPVGTLATSAIGGGMNLANGFDLVTYQNEVLAYVVGLTSENIVRVNFGSSIFSDITFENSWDNSDFSTIIDRLARISIVNDFGNYYALVTQFDAGFFTFTLDLKDLNNLSAPEDLGYANTQFNDIAGGYSDGDYYFYGINSTSLNRLAFTSDCGESSKVSQLEEPLVAYSNDGSHIVSLLAINGNNESSTSETVIVSADVAPSISYIIDASRCISNSNTFTPSLTALPSYTWDFGDGSMPAYINDETPTHQYLTPGTYTVRLDINDGTCNNFTTQEITIYPDPPTPTFTTPATECKNTLVSFTSTTDSSQHLGVLTYEWDFNGEGASTDQDPTFTFVTPGTKQITLKTLIPGCENTSSIFEVEISDGPTSAFSPSSFSICEGESISFTDASTNAPIDWSWDFDDGFASTDQNPTIYFLVLGTTMYP